MKVTQSLLLTGSDADSIRALIDKLSSPEARRFWGITEQAKQFLKYSAFPDTGRALFFCPTAQSRVCIIEFPVDDPSPTTLLNIIARPCADGRWEVAYSPKAYNSYVKTCEALNLSVGKDVERYYVPTYTCYPEDVGRTGVTRKGLQVHALSSAKVSRRTRQLDPTSGGDYCSVVHQASDGCAFVSDITRLNDATNGAKAILHVGGVANTYFSHKENSLASVSAIFNFEDDDPLVAAAVEAWEAQHGSQSVSLLVLLSWYSRMVISTYSTRGSSDGERSADDR